VFENREIFVINGVQALLLYEFPKPLDQIEVGRIGREIQKLNAKWFILNLCCGLE
jgi:hypothetical protein